MNKIKTFLIHLLGGMTVQESMESDANSFMMGKYSTAKGLQQYAESIDGTPGDDWCKLMYNQLTETVDAIFRIAVKDNETTD